MYVNQLATNQNGKAYENLSCHRETARCFINHKFDQLTQRVTTDQWFTIIVNSE